MFLSLQTEDKESKQEVHTVLCIKIMTTPFVVWLGTSRSLEQIYFNVGPLEVGAYDLFMFNCEVASSHCLHLYMLHFLTSSSFEFYKSRLMY